MNNIDMLVDQLIAKEEPTIVQISTAKLHPFPAHPFKVQDDEDMEQLIQSIQMQGVLTPLVIRPLENGEYEVISGHRRLHACRKAGIQTVPALVYAIDRDAAAIALVDSNLHAIRKFMEMQTLTAPLLRELIDHIDVYETEGTGKNRIQRIMIHYKFVGVIEIPDDGDNYTADTRKGVAVEYVTNSV